MTCRYRKFRTKIFVILTLLIVLTRTAQAGNEQTMQVQVDAFMANLMENLDVVPGYSVAVVTPNSTIIAKGYGTTAYVSALDPDYAWSLFA